MTLNCGQFPTTGREATEGYSVQPIGTSGKTGLASSVALRQGQALTTQSQETEKLPGERRRELCLTLK
jgi:hypothetical protein